MQLNAVELHSGNDRTSYCVPSLLDTESTGVICEACESFDFGTSLQNVYPLLSCVFKHLKFSDLKSAEEVNDVWERYASEELSKRNGASWVSLTKMRRKLFKVENSANFLQDDASFGLVFYGYKRMKLDKFLCLHGAADTVRIPFAEYLSREVVPREREFWTLPCRNVYRINPASSRKFKSVFSALLFPKIPDVKIRRFCSSMKDLGSILEENLDSDEIVDCLLVFTMSNPEKRVPALMQEILKRQTVDSIALCGGVIARGIKLFNQPDKQRLYTSSHMYCVTFTRNRDLPPEFEAFSMVIQREDEFEAKVSEFKRRTVLRKKSFIIRVCCAAKSLTEAETFLVYKYFPETFVVGLDVDGEIGWDKFVKEEEEEEEEEAMPKKKSKILPESCHQYSTILVLITWGPKL